jgi:hypothetical protein
MSNALSAVTYPGAQAPAVSIRALALPAEHGGWGLLAEPLLLGLLLTPSAAGAALALAAVAGFLARHPARIVLADTRRSARYPRTRWAALLTAGYCTTAVAALVVALFASRGPLLAGAAVVAPAALVYLAYDLRLRSREAVAELCGAISLSAVAPLLTVAAGWPASRAFGLWVLIGGRAITSVSEVRVRLRRARGAAVSPRPVLALHGAWSVAAMAVARAGLVPWGAAAVPIALTMRAIRNLRAGAPLRPPREIGWSEVRVGVAGAMVWVIVYGLAGAVL